MTDIAALRPRFLARVAGLKSSFLDQQRDFAGAATVWEAAAGPSRSLREPESRCD